MNCLIELIAFVIFWLEEQVLEYLHAHDARTKSEDAALICCTKFTQELTDVRAYLFSFYFLLVFLSNSCYDRFGCT